MQYLHFGPQISTSSKELVFLSTKQSFINLYENQGNLFCQFLKQQC